MGAGTASSYQRWSPLSPWLLIPFCGTCSVCRSYGDHLQAQRPPSRAVHVPRPLPPVFLSTAWVTHCSGHPLLTTSAYVPPPAVAPPTKGGCLQLCSAWRSLFAVVLQVTLAWGWRGDL